MKYLAVPLIFLTGCVSRHEIIPQEKEAAVKIYVTSLFQKADSTLRLDSAVVIRMDSLTLQDVHVAQLMATNDRFRVTTDYLQAKMNVGETELKLYRLYNQLSPKLGQEHLKNAQKIQQEAGQLMKDLTAQQTISDSLNRLITENRDKRPIGLKAITLYQARKADQSITRDTIHVWMNFNYDIIDKQDFINKDL